MISDEMKCASLRKRRIIIVDRAITKMVSKARVDVIALNDLKKFSVAQDDT